MFNSFQPRRFASDFNQKDPYLIAYHAWSHPIPRNESLCADISAPSCGNWRIYKRKGTDESSKNESFEPEKWDWLRSRQRIKFILKLNHFYAWLYGKSADNFCYKTKLCEIESFVTRSSPQTSISTQFFFIAVNESSRFDLNSAIELSKIGLRNQPESPKMDLSKKNTCSRLGN